MVVTLLIQTGESLGIEINRGTADTVDAIRAGLTLLLALMLWRGANWARIAAGALSLVAAVVGYFVAAAPFINGDIDAGVRVAAFVTGSVYSAAACFSKPVRAFQTVQRGDGRRETAAKLDEHP